MTSKVSFSDRSIESTTIDSTWRTRKEKLREEVECQTDPSLWDFNERETQSGYNTNFIQDEVSSSTLARLRKAGKSETLFDHLCTMHKEFNEDHWRSVIEAGKVTIDYEVCMDPLMKLDKENFIEYVHMKADVGTQTMPNTVSATKMSYSGDFGIGIGIDESLINFSSLNTFLRRVFPLIEEEREMIIHSRAFDGYEVTAADTSEEVSHWRTLSVDLEKKKVVFPDWSNAKHFRGRIAGCTVTRNKERLYDIDYEDGMKLSGVREEHIRVLDPADGGKSTKKSGGVSTTPVGDKAGRNQEKKARLQEGVRVHARVTFKGGIVKFVPSRITRVRGGTYDVECEGGRIETSLSLDDILLGLEEGSDVEARRPNKVQLQCTAVSWNATGSTLAVSYGKFGIAGWCDYRGAVCLWNVFGKNFNADSPDYVLDYSSCMLCVKCHPVQPAIVAGGSFNGEVVVWDLTQLPSDPRYATSQISRYSHREPVMAIDWVYHHLLREWVIASAGADGRILFWSLANRLEQPIRGTTLHASKKSKGAGLGKEGGRRQQYPSCYGATSVAFSSSLGQASSVLSSWFVVGQEGGGIERGLLSQVLAGNTAQATAQDETYPPISRGDKSISHEAHTGAVNSLDCSAFSRDENGALSSIRHLFLSGGGDGSVRLFHMLQRVPLRRWDPVPPPTAAGATGAFSAITCVKFSPVRPSLFAASSADGFVYLFDLSASESTPVIVLEAPTTSQGQSSAGSERDSGPAPSSRAYRAGGANAGARRVGITGIAFNPKQRDLLAACDFSGKVHIWRLGWGLANRHKAELKVMEKMAGSVAEEIEHRQTHAGNDKNV